MTKKEHLQAKLASVQREIDMINADPNHGFRDDESLCYEALAIQRQIDEIEKQEQAD